MKPELRQSLLFLDLSKAVAFDLLYHPVIGTPRFTHYPIIRHLPPKGYGLKRKNRLP